MIVLRHKIGTPIGWKIPKMGVITAEPPYHAQVWEYPPWSKYMLEHLEELTSYTFSLSPSTFTVLVAISVITTKLI